MSFIIAIDGPAGAGKGTITKIIAEKLGLTNLDTGAIYRCVALEMIKQKIGMEEEDKIKEMLKNIDIKMSDDNKVFLNDEEVSERIRENEVNNTVSPVSAIPIVREKVLEIERTLVENKNAIVEGRDTGTAVFPNADVKIYLDASVEKRAERRMLQNEEKGIPSTYEEVLENIKDRDKRDSTRKYGPLKKAEDAVYVDSTNLTIEEVVNKIIHIIEDRRNRI